MQWPIIIVAREDFNQRTSAELETRMTHIEAFEKSKRYVRVTRPKIMSRIRNPDWENDDNLKADIQKYVLQNLTRKEVLDFLGRDYPQYAWSLPTLSRRMAHFGVKYVDYGTDLKVVEKAVKEETSGPGQLLGYRSMHKKLREHHHLAIPRGLVYDVMTQIDPEGLESRGKVGQKKRHRGPTGTFTSLVRYLLVLFFHRFTKKT